MEIDAGSIKLGVENRKHIGYMPQVGLLYFNLFGIANT